MPNIPTWSDLLSSPAAMRRLMRAWPPYAAAGIRTVEIADDWSRCVMELRLRPWTANFVGTQFGGSMFSMTDPWWMILMMRRLGPGYVVWDKAAEIEFVAPGRGDVRATFELTDEMVGAGAGGGRPRREGAPVVSRGHRRPRRHGRCARAQAALRAREALNSSTVWDRRDGGGGGNRTRVH
jgi:acyl-coenzyme A thioesterase PaaI-like protein